MKKKCDCGDPDCKREVKGTKEGKLSIINHFTCGKTKKVMKDITKQPPQELVEKMRQAVDVVSTERIKDESISYDYRPHFSSAFVDGAIWMQAQEDKVIGKCAQIAIDENYQLTEEVEMGLRISEGLRKQNHELREFIQEVMETTTNKTHYEKAKQLLNK